VKEIAASQIEGRTVMTQRADVKRSAAFAATADANAFRQGKSCHYQQR
jgi:hypothetical protein